MTTLSESTIVETDPETGGKVHDILDSRTHFEEPLTCDSKDATTPPSNRPESPTSLHNNRSLSPGSPTVRQTPLVNVFETSLTEEDITAQQAAALASLSQLDVWTVDDVDLLSKFNNFKHQQPQPRLALALDGIADVSSGSGFFLTLSQKERMLASAVAVKDIDEKWPALSLILSRVCVPSHSYEDVVQALRKEDPGEPIVDYIRDITYHYSHYLKFSDEVPRNINEREGFGDLTWPFIRGALTLADIPSRCFEIPVVGTKERKNHGRDLSVETEEQASMADGVALFGDHQIYLAEASLIYEPKLDKQIKDKFKMARCMRDSWNSQIRSIAREAMPPTGLSVFGSTSFGDETKFYAMDFAGTGENAGSVGQGAFWVQDGDLRQNLFEVRASFAR
ncbi:MAG: hypothetical protein JOS17DRAFT_781434 [Linnemannia elongata]|nr:MAG: hypothetical protein JOS17DRAFT_781434 [Linnemannia elongata]